MTITNADINLIKLYTNDEIFSNGAVQNIINSGLFTYDSLMTAFVNAGDAGLDIVTPYIKKGAKTAATIMDDSDNNISFAGQSKGNIMNKIMFLAKAWSEKSISRELDSGLDLLDVLEKNFLQVEWAEELEMRAISSLIGCEQADATRDEVTASNEVFTRSAVARAMNVISGKQKEFGYIVVHPDIYTEMTVQDGIDFVKPSTVPFSVGFYGNLEVIVSEDVTVETRAEGDVYTSYICKPGVFSFARGTLANELEYVRDEKTGNGAGEDGFISRLKFVLGVNGFSYDGSTQAKETGATWAELQDSAKWTRVVDVKDSGFVTLKTLLA